VDSPAAVENPEPHAEPPPPRRPGTETTLTLVSGVLAGVCSVYVATPSTLVTNIATIAAITLAAIVLTRH
jgi:hypothetical protein